MMALRTKTPAGENGRPCAMNKNTKKRLAALERDVGGDGRKERGIFCSYPSPGDNASPLAGWRFEDTDILRLPGEDDDALAERAMVFARQFVKPPCLPLFLAIDG